MAEVLDKFKFQTEDDLFAAVGYGEVSAQVVCNRLTEKNAANKVGTPTSRSRRVVKSAS